MTCGVDPTQSVHRIVYMYQKHVNALRNVSFQKRNGYVTVFHFSWVSMIASITHSSTRYDIAWGVRDVDCFWRSSLTRSYANTLSFQFKMHLPVMELGTNSAWTATTRAYPTNSLTVLAATVVVPSNVNVKVASLHGHDESSVVLTWTQDDWPITLATVSTLSAPTSLIMDIVITIHSPSLFPYFPKVLSVLGRTQGYIRYVVVKNTLLIWVDIRELCW